MEVPHTMKWGFPKVRGTILGVPIIKLRIFWGPYWGPLFRETTKWKFPKIGRPQHRCQTAIILFMGTPKKFPLILGNF